MNTSIHTAPVGVPEDLTAPTAVYRKQAVLAMVGLLGFVLLYLLLAAWFSWSAFRLLAYAYAGGFAALTQWLVGLSCLFLAVFMIKALFFVRKGGDPDDMEITAESEPELFEFLFSLADSIGAPRPHRVFLSAQVNAAVFYDLSIKNLIFPSKKNLLIGLPLVNALNMSEFKAVLSHEFGHFAQRSMAIGTWVYIAQQIAAYIIAQRDALDRGLRSFSRSDIRVAWIAWTLRLIVWSLRALLETVFEWVVIAQRALSREMEFQADLVAVSQTGSDAIVNALYKLPSADDAWSRTLQFYYNERAKGHLVEDVFELQPHVLRIMASIYNDEEYGRLPTASANPGAETRLFEADLARPPKMWSTHPPSQEREDNAKQRYVSAPPIETEAWELFQDSADLRLRFTKRLSGTDEPSTEIEANDQQAESVFKPLSQEDAIRNLESSYGWEYLKPQYQGVYLGRSCVRHSASIDQLLGDGGESSSETSELYTDEIADQMEKLRQVGEEKGLLQALKDGRYEAPGGIIRHRGDELKPHELPSVISSMEDEYLALEESVVAHDKRCRLEHFALTQQWGEDWRSYYKSIVALLHYAEHTAAHIEDASGVLNNVYQVITADKNISRREWKRLAKAAEELQQQLAAAYQHCGDVGVPKPIADDLAIETWLSRMGELKLPPPTVKNLSEWLEHYYAWVADSTGMLKALKTETLEHLLQIEQALRTFKSGDVVPPLPGEVARVPADYAILIPGEERARQSRLGLWDRFQTADGLLPSLSRLAVSLGVVGFALYVSAITPSIL